MYLSALCIYLMTALMIVYAEEETGCEKAWNDYYDNLPENERDPTDSVVKYVLIEDCSNGFELTAARMHESRITYITAIKNFKKGFDAYQLKDYDAAFKAFLIAARAGDTTAQYNLAVMNAKGEGAPKNIINAYMWVDVAVKNGVEEGRDLRNELLKDMSSQQVFKAQTLINQCTENVYIYSDSFHAKTTIKNSCLNMEVS